MAKSIVIFNYKGGVSKTTTTFNLGWMLASKGKNVLIVDADPQCNLTALVLGYKSGEEFSNFYQRNTGQNLKDGLKPAFESKPTLIKAIECVHVDGREGLFLLPGHLGLSEYEVTLGLAQELSGSITALKNLPGSFKYFIEKTASFCKADYVLIDTNPSLSSINQNLVMTSDYLVLPTNPDYFSVMAIDSLAKILPIWHSWAEKASSLPLLKDADYPFPKPDVKFLGTVIQNYRLRKGGPTIGFQTWIDRINESVSSKLIPALNDANMVMPMEIYKNAELEDDFCLASIPDFNTLVATSQEKSVPIFALSPEQIGRTGVVLAQTLETRDNFEAIFSNFADKIIGLTEDESCD